MSKNNFFAMISRMKYINRWSLMRNTVTENLSEHSLEVAFIAHLLCLIRNKRFGGNVNAERAAVIAMYHDTTEIITGDLPTPVKYYNKDIREIYGDIEKNAADNLISQLPDDLKDEYEEIISGGDDEEIKSLVKAADKISALIKCIEERQMGNKDFLQAEQSTLKSIKAMNIKEADVFLEEFVEGYGLTLDELTKQ
ncbi:MAG: 5'-deoxynucleotidase [Ruminococcus sp.]|nr:5'-deoxynucleotidase [Ruminococcus sp.]